MIYKTWIYIHSQHIIIFIFTSQLVQVNHTWQEKYDALRCKTKHLESNLEKQQTQLEQEIEENTKLRKLVDNLSSDLQNLSPEFHQSKKDPRRKSQDQICYTSDDIEALKQQVILDN